MKLRNKKTGEIREARIASGHLQLWETTLQEWVDYDDLDFLARSWEYYEGPTEYWFITSTGIVAQDEDNGSSVDRDRKAIGNYFETEEETVKALEKLKAWKRLKDKGFKFECWYGGSRTINFEISDYKELLLPEEICDDLKLLFGGEDE